MKMYSTKRYPHIKRRSTKADPNSNSNTNHSRNPTKQTKRKRTRNITWFNPPYSVNVKTNIGKKFLQLIDKCFPPGHKLNKILNRNTIKISYSCMPNMKQIISSHNRKISEPNEPKGNTMTSKSKCNCRVPNECPISHSH